MIVILGALLTIAAVMYMAGATLRRGRLSDPAPHPAPNLPTSRPTLEPRRRGLGFLGLSQNWPGLVMMAIGLILLLSVVVL
ncbi:MAG: hypothetical protein EOR68_03840 [Mesorhizobium sp.]|uniref:hypothetical protein n=1 Tax=Mesorhizobium sp. TaxID=1871066 RepID=UPI000FE6B706|nr:hypothetical protein [Mesorhizobium sp.]RWM04347.1 MAG: hypothetical protein EOR68_03840 [Mesorhizobium sp.]TIP51685.1 MAG: hypothetical protein E5X77_00760 [Mesorhizobium sp.]